MKRRQVQARLVKSVGWEAEVLEVEYQNGALYHYFDVPEGVYIKSLLGNVDKKIRRIGQSHTFKKMN